MNDGVEYEVDARTFRRLVAAGEVERATVRYDSAFGGEQAVEGEVHHNERVLEPDTATVGDREIDDERVLSTDTGARGRRSCRDPRRHGQGDRGRRNVP